MKTKQKTIEVIGDNARGIYLPQFIAQQYGPQISGIPEDTIPILLAGPDAESYDEAWDDVLSYAILTLDDGSKYRIQLTDNGDVVAIPRSWICDDVLGWVPPESETLRRYDLPSHWASAIFNGDYSGLSDAEEKEIDAWIADNVPAWTAADVSECSFFKHRPDSGGLACDALRYTFVLIR